MKAVEHELDFWRGFVKTDRFLKGWVADIPTPELHQVVKDFFAEHVPKFASVLDVGSGVVSILHGMPDIHLVAVDMLATEYKTIFDYGVHGVIPPLPIPGESLSGDDVFDVVHISNALDHTTDPQKVFNNMVRALKPGGFIIVQGFENEATHENYQGMHQHNLWVNGDKLFPLDTSAAKVFRVHRFENHFQLQTWFIFIAQKPI